MSDQQSAIGNQEPSRNCHPLIPGNAVVILWLLPFGVVENASHLLTTRQSAEIMPRE